MSIPGSQVITKARALLVDVSPTRWPDTDLVGWLNTGQRQICILKPNLFVRPITVQLVEGPLQVTTDMEFIRVNCNINSDGSRGSAVSPITQDILDRFYPGWQGAVPSNTATNYMFDKRDSQSFFVFPPQTSSPGKVEITTIPYPADVTIVSSVITGNIIDDIYEGALIDYVVYRALQEDTETADIAISDKYYQAFIHSLGMMTQMEAQLKDETGYANRA